MAPLRALDPSGSSRLSVEDTEPSDGGGRCGFRALPTNRESLTWSAEARDLASTSLLPPVVELISIHLPGGPVQPCKLRFLDDHVGESRGEVWLLAEPLVGLDIGSLLEPSANDIVARGGVCLLKVGEDVSAR